MHLEEAYCNFFPNQAYLGILHMVCTVYAKLTRDAEMFQ